MAHLDVRVFDRHKFMWDGEEEQSRGAAEARQKIYEAQGFETRLVEEGGESLLYTRRVVKEIVVEGEPPTA